MRGEALACVLGLASFACSNGDSVPAEGGAPLDGGALPEGASPESDASPAPSTQSADSGCVPLQTDAAPLPLGATCSSPQEGATTYPNAVEGEVGIVTGGPQCGANHVCLYNHFRGRVSCPYGQDATGRGPDGTAGCLTAGTCQPVRPTPVQAVAPQCADRPAGIAAICSCRCADIDGGTDGNYCACPSGMTCTQLVSLGPDISGAYCIKSGTEWDGGECAVSCDPTSAPCP